MSDDYPGKVLDNNGMTHSGEEAVKFWSAHFREVLQGSKEPRRVSLDLVFAVRHLIGGARQ